MPFLRSRATKRFTGLPACALLIVLRLLGATQAPPDFVQEAKEVPRGEWTASQILNWRSRAWDYLGSTPVGDSAREEVFKYLADWEKILNEHDPRPALDVVTTYLAEFPAGDLHDEMDWERVQLQEFRHERSDEDVTETLEIAQAYERYLAGHSTSAVADRIRLALGIQYQIAFEILDTFPGRNPGFGAADAVAYRNKAHGLWEGVLKSEDEDAAAEARELLAKDQIFILRSSLLQTEIHQAKSDCLVPLSGPRLGHCSGQAACRRGGGR